VSAFLDPSNPVAQVAALWVLFILSHVGLAVRAVRDPLIERFGKLAFIAVYDVVASVLFIAATVTYGANWHLGPGGVTLGSIPELRVALIGVIVLGCVLIAGALAAYPASPMAPFVSKVPPPRGMERITRHPYFIGNALLFGAHALLAHKLISTVYFSGFVILPLLGTWHQSRKLLAEMGPDYQDYLDQTSVVPFAAILTGRQQLVPRELPWGHLVGGVAAAWALRQVHDHLMWGYGLPLILAMVGGAWFLFAESMWKRFRDAQAP